MSNRLFDPTAFLNENVEAGATRRDPRPAGETIGQVMALDFKTGDVKKQGSPNFGKPWYRMDVKIEVTDPEYLAQCAGNPTKETFTYGIMYDGDEVGRPKVGPNMNIQLHRFRDACGANGKPLNACVGAMLRLAIVQKPHPTEPDVVLDEIYSVTKA